MNRQEAITQIAQLCVLCNNTTIGIILPSVNDIKLFQRELLVKIDAVPEWLLKLRYRQQRYIEDDTGNRIKLLKSGRDSRGMSFNCFYISSKVTEEQKSEFVFSYLTAPLQSIFTFEDN